MVNIWEFAGRERKAQLHDESSDDGVRTALSSNLHNFALHPVISQREKPLCVTREPNAMWWQPLGHLLSPIRDHVGGARRGGCRASVFTGNGIPRACGQSRSRGADAESNMANAMRVCQKIIRRIALGAVYVCLGRGLSRREERSGRLDWSGGLLGGPNRVGAGPTWQGLVLSIAEEVASPVRTLLLSNQWRPGTIAPAIVCR